MRKILILFEFNSDMNKLLESALFLKKNYRFEILPLYIKDIRKNGITPPMLQGVPLTFNDTYTIQQNEIENQKIEELKKCLREFEFNEELNVECGFPWDIIKEYLKKTDILMFEKEEVITETTISILKNHFKPLIILGKKALRSFNDLMISSDDGVKINKSVFEFLNIFPMLIDYEVCSLNYNNKENRILNYIREKEKKVKYFNFEGEEAEKRYYERLDNADIVIMGNLSRGYLFEKIIGRKGVNILEKTISVVFIG